MTTTLIPIICAVVAAVVVLAATPLASRLARAVGAVDVPSGRRIHSAPTPRLGGLAILAGFLVPVLYYFPEDEAARALVESTELEPRDIVRRALTIAGEICVYTNTNITIIEPGA